MHKMGLLVYAKDTYRRIRFEGCCWLTVYLQRHEWPNKGVPFIQLMLFFKNIYLFGSTESWLQHAGFSLVVLHGLSECVFLNFKKTIYWTIVDSQCCITFRHSRKWFSYIYIYICVCVCVCIYIHTNKPVCVCVCIYIYAHIYLCLCICIIF